VVSEALLVTDPVSLALSAGAVTISAGTAWLTLLRRGQIRMTRPTLFYLGPDGPGGHNIPKGAPKVYVRMLLYSTARRGNVIESMYVTVSRGETKQNFSVWVYREAGRLSRGSGLFVDQEGVAMDHHFLLPSDGTRYEFTPGEYRVDIYAKLVHSQKPLVLGSVESPLTEAVAREADREGGGVFFDWSPDLGRYNARARPVQITQDEASPLLAILSALGDIPDPPGTHP
jgi:hypothetical protein